MEKLKPYLGRLRRAEAEEIEESRSREEVKNREDRGETKRNKKKKNINIRGQIGGEQMKRRRQHYSRQE